MSASPEFTIDQALLDDEELRTLMSGMLSGAYGEDVYLRDVAALCRSRPGAGTRMLSLIERYHRLGRMPDARYHTVRAAAEQALGRPPAAACAAGPDPDLQPWDWDADLTRDLSAVAPEPPALVAADAGQGPALVIEAAEACGGEPKVDHTGQTVLLPNPADAPSDGHAPGLEPGRVLHQRYELLSLLGRGGMGSVFRALDRQRVHLGVPDCQVALKVLNPGRSVAESAAALAREFSTARQLSHPNIVKVFDLDHDGEIAFYTMELVEGERLNELLARSRRRLPRAQALSLLRQVGAAVAHAHAHGFPHGDLKPHNIMVSTAGEVRVLDFCAANGVLREPWISDGLSGEFRPATPAYASCEQLEGRQAEPRDDLYALGCIAYLLLSGRHPFDSVSALTARAQDRKPSRPSGLDARRWRALKRALSWTRAQRSFGIGEWLRHMGVEPDAERPANGPQRDLRTASPLPAARPIRAVRAHPSGAARGVRPGLVAAWTLLAVGIGMAAVALSSLHASGARARPAALAALLRTGQDTSVASPGTRGAAVPQASASSTAPAVAPAPAPGAGSALAVAGVPGARRAAQPASGAATAAPGRSAASAAAPEPPQAAFSASHYQVSGNSPAARIVIRRAGGSASSALRFVWWTVPGSAKPNVDYASLGRRIQSIAPGKRSVSVFVPIILNPLLHGSRRFSVALDTLGGSATQAPPTTPAAAQSLTTVTIERAD